VNARLIWRQSATLVNPIFETDRFPPRCGAREVGSAPDA
jgi:hypothetical protein